MTLVQTQFRRASARPAHGAVADTMDAAGPQVWEDMTVEVALCVMAAARTSQLVVCDADGLYTALVTRARLTAVRDSPGYTDRIRLGEIAEAVGRFASPPALSAGAERARSRRRPGALPLADEHDRSSDVLPLSR
ncbi:hypothetical protein [Streptomyces sp. DH24]|uniref:hypothetical protein n=1 Tax=Streptomyces sp. DH24 TaxID=3040123 RepID=UPI00244338BA|nr:hypothetical protein [Streptomyces sp. DH24]MDG9720656.1 hypothetical protein [Streptomyces sp. DH24]